MNLSCLVCVPPSLWGRSAGSFPEQRLVIEPIGESETNIFKPKRAVHLLDAGELTYQCWLTDSRRWRIDLAADRGAQYSRPLVRVTRRSHDLASCIPVSQRCEMCFCTSSPWSSPHFSFQVCFSMFYERLLGNLMFK